MTGFMNDHGWVALTGFLAAGSCGLLGCYLILRRMSLLGDAISHAILPGIVLAFLLTGSRTTIPMLIGAAVFGVLTSFFIEALDRTGRVQQDAAIGITFTTLFALGVVLVTFYSRNVDLDQECVLYGEIALVPLATTAALGFEVPTATLLLAGIFAVDVLFIALFWKELEISSFDPGLARAMGIATTLVHYLLMGMVSLTIVGAFESVGAILVVAMLIVPGATAYLLSERLGSMLAWSLAVSALASALGKALAFATDGSVAGCMAVAAGGLFLLALLLSPRQGIIPRWWARTALATRIAVENLIGELARVGEKEAGAAPAPALDGIATKLGWRPRFAASVLWIARRRGLVAGTPALLELTPAGAEEARRVRTAHRAWENELERLGYDQEHAHASAHRLEHLQAPGEVDREPKKM